MRRIGLGGIDRPLTPVVPRWSSAQGGADARRPSRVPLPSRRCTRRCSTICTMQDHLVGHISRDSDGDRSRWTRDNFHQRPQEDRARWRQPRRPISPPPTLIERLAIDRPLRRVRLEQCQGGAERGDLLACLCRAGCTRRCSTTPCRIIWSGTSRAIRRRSRDARNQPQSRPSRPHRSASGADRARVSNGLRTSRAGSSGSRI